MTTALFITGFALVIASVAIVNPVAAMAVAGVGLMVGAVAIERGSE